MKTHSAAAGAASAVNASSSSRPEGRGLPVELLVLAGAGVAAALLHQAFRWPLHLPGHHGLEWLALLMAARLASNRPGAALAVAMGAAATALSIGGGNDAVLRPLTYVLQGLALDGLWVLSGRASQLRWWRAATLGALVHLLPPLLKLLFAAGGLQAASLATGLGWPLLTHACFGAVGAAAGAAALGAWRQARRR